jgi:hypothetical protein
MGKLTKAGRITRKADFESEETMNDSGQQIRDVDGRRGGLDRLDAVVFCR